jgi:hypothetical protein
MPGHGLTCRALLFYYPVEPMKTGAAPIFLDENHRYPVAGVEYPSVNQIIREGRQEKYVVDPWYLERGQRIHEAIKMDSLGELDLEKWQIDLHNALTTPAIGHPSPCPACQIIGRFKAAKKFLADYCGDDADYEVKLHHASYGYCGTADVIMSLKGAAKRCAVDWKGSLSPLVEPQLGGYSVASPLPCDMACGVELHDDGSYKCHWGSRHPQRDKAQFNLGHAERWFLALLTCRNFNKEKGLI